MRIAVALCLLLSGATLLRAGALTVYVAPRFGEADLAFDAMVLTNAAGQTLSVTRLDLLLSAFAVRPAGGDWVALEGQYAYLSLREGRNMFRLEGVPEGPLEGLRWQVGLPAAINNGDPSVYAPDHPLNPNVNGLHWSWLGGYVFLAQEGLWQTAAGGTNGYSFHLATDQGQMPVELALATGTVEQVAVALDVARVLGGEPPIAINVEASATHSRQGDALAGQLRANVSRAFAVTAGGARGRAHASEAAAPAALPPGTTAYRFRMPATFPLPKLPRDNPMTEEGVALGRALFHEPLLSGNGAQSCVSCHHPEAGFVDAGKRFSVGAEGAAGERNAMPLFNLAWKSAFFWDGRAATLREQVLVPIQDPVEMHQRLPQAVAALAATTNYPALFARAFGSPEVTVDRMTRAFEQFLMTLTAHDSRLDRAMRAAAGNSFVRAMGARAVLTPDEQAGFALFATEFDPRRGFRGADCFHCHGGPLFTNNGFANNGLDATFADVGRFRATGKEGDRGKFAVPSLRNVAVTAPYMHDGRFATLEEVVEHYSTGVKRSATLDPNLAKHPDGGVPLSAEDKRQLVAFLKALTDSRWE